MANTWVASADVAFGREDGSTRFVSVEVSGYSNTDTTTAAQVEQATTDWAASQTGEDPRTADVIRLTWS